MDKRFVPLRWAIYMLLGLFIGNASAALDFTGQTRRLKTDAPYPQQILDQLLQQKSALEKHLQGEQFKSFLQELRRNTSQQHNQRGVLIVGGGRDMLANAAITLHVLRRVLRSQLPVEIVHFGPEEMPQDVLQLIQSYNATSNGSSNSADGSAQDPPQQGHVFVTDGLQAAPQAQFAAHHRQLESFRGFPAKVYALVFVTRFQQVLMMDADCMPLVDPALLFDLATFRQHGNIFWPDHWNNAWVNASIYSILAGMPHPPWHDNKHHRLVESGQLLMDRVKLADVLQYLWLLNSHHEWVYKHMHGDKDTFLLAFAMAGKLKAFKQSPCFVRVGVRQIPGHKHAFHHLATIQSLPPATMGAAIATAMFQTGPVALPALPNAAHLEPLLAAAGGEEAMGRAEPQVSQPHSAQGLSASHSRRTGVPVFVHRTSFNSKFFPDCLSKEKIDSHYCEVQWVSMPLSDMQASKSLKPHMYAYDDNQIDTNFYSQHCSSSSSSGGSSSGGSGGGGGHRNSTSAVLPGPAAPSGRRLVALWHLQLGTGHMHDPSLADSPTALSTAAVTTVVTQHQQQQEQQQQHACKWWMLMCKAVATLQQLRFALLPQRQQKQQEQQQYSASPKVLQGGMQEARHLQQFNLTARPPAVGRRVVTAWMATHAVRRRQQQLAAKYIGLPPERGCEKLQTAVGEDVVPIPVMKVELFPHMQGVLQQSHEAFRLVREALKVQV